MYPDSTLQVESHPSSSSEFWSSHSSSPALRLSAQCGSHSSFAELGYIPGVHCSQVSIEDGLPPNHTKLFSMAQLLSHPFPSMRSPSSHSSTPARRESDQTVSHIVLDESG